MDIELLLTSEATEPGEAAVVRNGMPVYSVGGEEVEVNYAEVSSALSKANAEAQQRREALEKIAGALDLDVDVRNPEGLEAITARLEGYDTDTQELESLRAAKEAGKLDDTAEDKIKTMAQTMRQEEIDRLTAELEKTKAEAGKAKARADATRVDLDRARMVTALRNFYDQAESFREGALETFLMASQQPQEGGYKWRPTGETNAAGIPTIALMDDSGNIKKTGDNVTPVTFKSWVDTTLRNNHPLLFKETNGAPGGVNPDGGGGSTKNPAEMSRSELDAAARAQFAG